MKKKKPLMKIFTFYSSIAFLIMGITLSYFLIQHVNKLFSTFYSEAELRLHIIELNKLILTSIFFGLLILFGLLYKVISKTSKKMDEQNMKLEKQNEELDHAYNKLSMSYKSTVNALSKAIDARDPYTAGHSERVSYISKAIGKVMKLPEKKLYELEIAALLHDVGKLGVPDSILNKVGKLNTYEYNQIKCHPEIAVNILETIDFIKEDLPSILHHHERVDGFGYPSGLKGENIPLNSRIIAVSDAYDAMTSNRPYRQGLSHEMAIEEIIRNKDTQFDSKIVDAFLSVFSDVESSDESQTRIECLVT
ncbi:MAG: hypothetical protein CVU98_08205 [Firmicutes bacterium HGW-Firmicutes-3]|jgi:HD-GYP domain-containing protein (c-di-GMP phosphodiesterase class II)|nr:MAG: hypothetical protein CVU98_08205 [Firmicutes bacterium HGW-Firmicutes-3]